MQHVSGMGAQIPMNHIKPSIPSHLFHLLFQGRYLQTKPPCLCIPLKCVWRMILFCVEKGSNKYVCLKGKKEVLPKLHFSVLQIHFLHDWVVMWNSMLCVLLFLSQIVSMLFQLLAIDCKLELVPYIPGFASELKFSTSWEVYYTEVS